jgi:catechol 2,3-dioxygenase-like lactoylglutathione lyase family enzyme
MAQHISAVTLVVPDYDEAIAFYVGVLGLIEDRALSTTKRWVRVAPAGPRATCLLLAKADGEIQRSRIGNQTGGRVAFFLTTDDFARDHAAMLAKGVPFLESPRTEPYGTVAVFQDPFGNRWDLIQPAREGVFSKRRFIDGSHTPGSGAFVA